MELWVQHLCLFAGCAPTTEAVTDVQAAELPAASAEREAFLEDA